jgi:hypothetical protein
VDQTFGSRVLREYALLADGERGILVGPHGDFAWMCAPRWDSDAVFSTLIGGSGVYAVTPTARYVWGGYYEEGSLIWRSRWVTDEGIVECREALAFPGDPHRAVVLRRVVACERRARMSVVLEPSAGFGSDPLRAVTQEEGGVWTGHTGDLRVRWSGSGQARPVGPRDHRLDMEFEVAAGRHHDLVLEISDRPLHYAPPDADRLWRATEAAWQRAVPRLEDVIARSTTRRAPSSCVDSS